MDYLKIPALGGTLRMSYSDEDIGEVLRIYITENIHLEREFKK
jgi:hypothetical protein